MQHPSCVCSDGNLLKEEFNLHDVSLPDCEVVQQVCEAVSTRSARLAAALVVAVVRKSGKVDGCTVAVDGELYHQHHQIRARLFFQELLIDVFILHDSLRSDIICEL